MTRPVSVVLPSLDATALLEAALPGLIEEFERRSLGDEAIVVDDSGEGTLQPWLAEHFPSVRCVTRSENGGFSKALTDGIEAARCDLVFSMNTDVVVTPGFLDPLVACLEDDVFAVVPRVRLHGEEGAIESLTEMVLEKGVASFRQRALEREPAEPPGQPSSVAFAVGGTMLFRAADFREMGGLDPLFEPFYWEDIDLSWRAWRAGKRIVYQPASIVDHQHRQTIGAVLSRELVTAALEKNHWLFQWKHLDAELLPEHVATLYRTATDAFLGDQREDLVYLALALEEAEKALAARERARPTVASFEALCRASRPSSSER